MNEDFTYVGFEPTTEEKSLAKKSTGNLKRMLRFCGKTAVLKNRAMNTLGK